MTAARASAAEARAPAGSLPRGGLLLLAALSITWGLNWPAMKLAVAELPVWSFRAFCLTVGALGLFAIAAATRQRIRPRRGEWRALLLCCLFNIVGWHLLSAYGLQLVAASKAAIIGYTMPIWAALLGPLVVGERLTGRIALGLLLGIVGLGLLFAQDLSTLGQSPLGTLVMLGAALSWALGTLLAKRFRPTLPTVSFTAWQIGLGAPVVVAGALAFDGPAAMAEAFAAMTGWGWLGLLYSTFVAVIFCHAAWFAVVKAFPAVVASVGTLAIPVVGFVSSALLLREPLGWQQVLALLLVCGGLVVVVVLPALRGGRQRRSAA